MIKITFDLFYELNQGSIISNTYKNVKKYWRIKDGVFEVKMYINKEQRFDWHPSDILNFPVAGVFKIEERFQK